MGNWSSSRVVVDLSKMSSVQTCQASAQACRHNACCGHLKRSPMGLSFRGIFRCVYFRVVREQGFLTSFPNSILNGRSTVTLELTEVTLWKKIVILNNHSRKRWDPLLNGHSHVSQTCAKALWNTAEISACRVIFQLFFFGLLSILGPHLRHMNVPRLGV